MSNENSTEETTATDRQCVLTGAPGENADDCTTHDHTGHPLALLAGPTVPAEDSDPACPKCGSALRLVRREVREMTHRLRSASIYDAGSIGLMADMTFSSDARNEEFIDVVSQHVECDGYPCDYRISGDDISVEFD